jgi:3-phenylpropionate/trans-cinnamate dioxygenase ferredoxin reductase subunit
LGNDDRITLVGDESGLPYDRPPLSKEILLGKAEPDSLALADSSTFTGLDVEYLPGTRATHLDLTQRSVTTSAGDLAFNRLVIATGARPRLLPDLPALAGIHTLRTIDDARAIRAGFEAEARVVVLGGGFIGAEVASAARDLGLQVTIVDLAPTLMLRGLGTTAGARLTDIAADSGVGLQLRRTIVDIVGDDRIEAVRLDDGTLVEADLLVLGLGAMPNTQWLAGSGLKISDGVVCDPTMRAAEGIYAVGDVARWQHPLYGSIRSEHWTTAGEHADAVAQTLTGQPTPCAEVPYVWSDQFGHKIQIAGLVGQDDEINFLIDEPTKFVAVAGSGGQQRSAIALNAPAALIRQRMKLAASPPWPLQKGKQ